MKDYKWINSQPYKKHKHQYVDQELRSGWNSLGYENISKRNGFCDQIWRFRMLTQLEEKGLALQTARPAPRSTQDQRPSILL